ncbi:MAG TPA: hypothetical protein VFR14_11985 [Candidatus Limnocylindrales bacterium]|nr:hypothetical protein [Candidatus Limnocylindrales bacterium]
MTDQPSQPPAAEPPHAAAPPHLAAPPPAASPTPAPPGVQYKGEPLDPERGPGLGCFRFQVAVLAVLVVLTPLTVAWRWPEWVSAALLFAVIVLLLVAGQTIIFLLRLVAADRRAAGRRRPLASRTKTVGELEDERADLAADPSVERADDEAAPPERASDDSGPVRQ